MKKYYTLFLFISYSVNSFGQSQNVTNFLDDCTLLTEKFITPSTDAAVYLSGGNWMTSAKKRKLYSFTFSAHANLFFIPSKDRDFQINVSDLKFFIINDLNGNTVNEAVLPTIFGGEGKYKLVGQLGGQPLDLDIPEGVNKEIAPYPKFQASLGLWKGFELIAKYTPNLRYKELEYQQYGVGLKHNLSQYFKSIEAKNIYFSALLAFSKESVTSSYINATSSLGTLGLNSITGKVQTYQMQFSASKEWKNFQLVISTINTITDLKYFLTGEKGTIEDVIPIQSIFNKNLESIYSTNLNSFIELSGRYKFNNIYLQSSLTVGKFFNTGLSIQYEFNSN